MSNKTYKPGEKFPKSSQAEIVGPRGGGTGNERTVTKGKPFAPTPKSGQRYKIVDPTKHLFAIVECAARSPRAYRA